MTNQNRKPLQEYNWAFVVGMGLNIGFVIVEVVFGFLSDSIALLADAGHNASDVLGLFLAWGAIQLAKRQPSQRHTYGWRSSTILAALFNGLILLVAVGGIIREAISRFSDPGAVASTTIIWVAAIGTFINLGTAFLFMRGRKQDLNVRGAFLHMIADGGVSIGVVITGLLIRATGWDLLDPVVSLVIAGIIFWGTWGLLRDAFHLAIGGVPEEIDIEAVRTYLTSLPGVEEVHDLHVWGLSTAEVALTAHLVKPDPRRDGVLIEQATQELKDNFDIDHTTLQWEHQALTHCLENSCNGERKKGRGAQ